MLFAYPASGPDSTNLAIMGSLAGTAEVEPVEDNKSRPPGRLRRTREPHQPPARPPPPPQVQRRPGRLALCNFGSWIVCDFHLHCQHFFVIDDKFLSCTRPITGEPQRDDPFAASLHLSQNDGLGLTIDVLHTYRARTRANLRSRSTRGMAPESVAWMPPEAWPTGLLPRSREARWSQTLPAALTILFLTFLRRSS